MTSTEIKHKLKSLHLSTAGDKAALQKRLAVAEKMGISPDDKVMEIHTELPKSLISEIQELTLKSSTFAEIITKEDLEMVVELRYNRITVLKDIIDKALRLTEQEVEIAQKKYSLKLSRGFASKYFNALDIADKTLEQRMLEYNQKQQQRQQETRDSFVTLLAQQSEREIDEQAQKLFQQGNDEQAEALLATLDNGAEALAESMLPEMKTRKVQANGVTFTEGFDFTVINLSKIKESFLARRQADAAKIRKVVVERGLEAESIVGEGGISVFSKPGVRKN